MDFLKLGGFIIFLREKSGITQKELAKKIGVNQSLVRMWEMGVCPPSVEKLQDLASALGVCAAELLHAKCLSSYNPSTDMTAKTLSAYEELLAYQMQIENKYRRQNDILFITIAIVLGIFLIDNISLGLFIIVVVPILSVICFFSSVLSYYRFRHTNKNSCRPIIAGIISLLLFLGIMSLVSFSFFLGGPLPN